MFCQIKPPSKDHIFLQEFPTKSNSSSVIQKDYYIFECLRSNGFVKVNKNCLMSFCFKLKAKLEGK